MLLKERLILMTQTTRHGSIRKVVEVIATKMRKAGVKVDIQHGRGVENNYDYKVVVHGRQLLKPDDSVRTHKSILFGCSSKWANYPL